MLFPSSLFSSLGADVIYDPVCLPHLVRLLKILLTQKKSCSQKQNDSWQGSLSDSISVDDKVNHINRWNANEKDDRLDGKVNGAKQANTNASGDGFDACGGKTIWDSTSSCGAREGPLAYIAFIIRNVDTFNQFLSLVDQANITITDLTETLKPINLLPYMQSYDRSKVRLLVLSCS